MDIVPCFCWDDIVGSCNIQYLADTGIGWRKAFGLINSMTWKT